MNCKYCKSKKVIKYGKYKNVQYYFCQKCKRKFANPDAIPKMQYSTFKIAGALNMYYEGMSLHEVRRNLIQQYNDYISDVTILKWVQRFSKLAIIEAGKYKPNVGSLWVADETVIELDGKNVWFWDMIDEGTRFLLSSHLSKTRGIRDVVSVMRNAWRRADKAPKVIISDSLGVYPDGIERVFGAYSKHIQTMGFTEDINTNLIERFHSTLKERTKVLRGFKTWDTAELILSGFLIHYNFFRPHMTLRDKTPAEVAKIKAPFKSWTEFVKDKESVAKLDDILKGLKMRNKSNKALY